MRHDDKEGGEDHAGDPLPKEWQPTLIQTAPDGGIAPGSEPRGPGKRLPPIGDTLCAMGPCRHFISRVTDVDYGNPEGTFSAEPILREYQCLVSAARVTELGDTMVYQCSRWDPLSRKERKALDKRREDYFRDHPEHRRKVLEPNDEETD